MSDTELAERLSACDRTQGLPPRIAKHPVRASAHCEVYGEHFAPKGELAARGAAGTPDALDARDAREHDVPGGPPVHRLSPPPPLPRLCPGPWGTHFAANFEGSQRESFLPRNGFTCPPQVY